MTINTIYVLTDTGRLGDDVDAMTQVCADEGFFITEEEAAARADELNKPARAVHETRCRQLEAINGERDAVADLLGRQNAALAAAGLPTIGVPVFSSRHAIPVFEEWVVDSGYVYFEVESIARYTGSTTDV